MIDPISVSATCRSCGTPVEEAALRDGLCAQCAAAWLAGWTQRASAATPAHPSSTSPAPPGSEPYTGLPYADAYGSQYVREPVEARQPDPDNPGWGIWSGIGVWVFSIAALFVAQAAIVFLLYFLDQQRGMHVPAPADTRGMLNWMMSQRVLSATIYSTIGAHMLTVAFCWAVVTRFNQRPFFASIGWNWAGRSPLLWFLLAIGVFIGINIANAIFIRILPQKESSFDELLKSGPQVRLAVAILASFSAPLVEEIVYRGVIFGGLRKRFPAVTTIVIVTLLFTGVHVLQYAGAWATIAGLTVLSLVLTVVRAASKSLLPCIVIHFVNNLVVSLFLVFGKSTDF